VATRPTRADRDRTVDRLREGVSAGLLTVEEFEERLDSAYILRTTEELDALVVGLPLPARRNNGRMTRSQKATLLGVAAIAVGLVVAAMVGFSSLHARLPAKPSAQTATTSPRDSFIPSTPAAPSDLAIGATTAGGYARHDPANQCGAFGTTTTIGGENCYIVVQFTNTTASAVNFVPADLSMVDQNGNTYSVAPVTPMCYDTVDVNGPVALKPGAHVSVQLCYPVMVGALPRILQGSRALQGLSEPITPGSVVGTWGGA
jgi:hypothetical protein